MLHRDIIIKWIGNPVKEPGYNVECVAWAKKYCEERGYPIKSFGGSAWNGWKTGKPFDNTWKKVLKTSFNAPSEGDIIFFDESRCKYGHVAVCSRFCTPLLLRCTDQNGTGKQDKIQARWYSYKSVVGWMHKL